MIVSKSHNQYVLFPNPFDEHLDSDNRWVKFAKIIPWDKLSGYYYSKMENSMGAGALDARIILGAIIIKHHEKLSDEGCIEAIQENLYMQYLLGLPSFQKEKVFAPSLFVEIRKRLGLDYWQAINEIIIQHNDPKDKSNGEDGNNVTTNAAIEPTNQGTINLDATIVEQDIQYPTDLGLLNESREKLEEIIDLICLKTQQEKPRTYRINARKLYLNVAKKKNKSHKKIRTAVGQQLNFVRRDLKYIETLLSTRSSLYGILNKYELKYLQVVNEVYRQQKEMYTQKTHSTAHRIVSIHQPHVRPMVRGKAGTNVEFGSKIGVCIHNGLTYLDMLSWESYNETMDLEISAENYKKRNGFYPSKINADQIYITRNNRSWCKERNIQLNGKPLGRPTEHTKEKLKELKKGVSERNCVEGKFGQAKRWYGMDNIHARLQNTSESMIGAIVVVLNLVRLVQQHVYTFLKYSYKLIYLNVYQLMQIFLKKNQFLESLTF
jgi:hypothetical protein